MSENTVVEVRDLVVSYGGAKGGGNAVDGVSFGVDRGEILAVVGESGSGKSTTVRALVGLLASSASTSGTVRVHGTDLSTLSERRLRKFIGRSIGYVPQDPVLSLDPVKTVGDQVAEVFRVLRGHDRAAAKAAALDLLERVAIPDHEKRYRQYAHELSGGMCQRVLIAIALASGASVIVADEPTSGLDVNVQKRVLDEFVALARENEVAVILVTHDLGIAGERADRILVMSGGKLVEEGKPGEVLTNPTHSYTRELLAAIPSTSRTPLIQSRLDEAVPDQDAGPAAAIEVRDLRKVFQPRSGRGEASSELVALEDVSFSVAAGRTLGVVGQSGSGKSTLSRIIANLEHPSWGSVRIEGRDVHGQSRKEQRLMRRQVQYVHQNPYGSLDPRLTVEQIIAEPLQAFGLGNRSEIAAKVAVLLDNVALPRFMAERKPAMISGGQRQRVAIARALALTPSVLVLDEPVSALDVSIQDRVLRLLVDLQTEFGLTYVFVSHDLGVIRLVSDDVLVLRHGVVVEHGSVSQVFAAPEHEYTRSLLEAIPAITKVH
ncbi:ABC transporter ATP-binding protein [Pseudonocardia ailaonensis]|uniref:ABC transporter ATP-binding protein n=1 Tax=Pseudonocardia ailaonensis TaxID=367279 RepID=A0ABN2NA64_9PSEU